MRHEQHEHAPVVEAWLKEPTWLPETDLARVSRLVHQTPQRRGRLPQLGGTRFKTMISATAMAAGVAVIALSGGILLNGLVAQGPTDDHLPAAGAETSFAVAPTAAAEPEATDDTPSVVLTAGADSGTFDTPSGPATWVRATGPIGTLPRLGTLLPWADGLAIWDGNISAPDGQVGRLWASSDGAEWQPVALPDDYTAHDSRDRDLRLTYMDGAHYLAHPRLDRIWRYDDGAWTELDTSAITRARPAGWAVSATGIDGPEQIDDKLVVRVDFHYTLPRGQLGLTRKVATHQMRQVAPDRYALCQPGHNSCSESKAPKVLRFKETAAGLVVRDDRTGERLGLLAGADASQLYEGRNAGAQGAFVLEGDEFVPIAWPRQQPTGEREQPPAGGPQAGDRRHLPAGWVALEFDEDEVFHVDGWHMHVGGAWVDLAGLGFPDVRPYETWFGIEGTDDATAFYFADYAADMADIWTIHSPEGP